MKTLIDNNLYINDLDECISSIVNLELLKNKSILITGATGLIGSFIVDSIYRINKTTQLNIKVYALGRSLKRLCERFVYAINDANFIFVEQDVTNKFELTNTKMDYCIHAASNAYPSVMYSDPVGTIMANLQGTYNLLEYLRQNNGTKFLMVSSGEVYGKCDKDIKKFTEDMTGLVDVLEVRSCYPLSKRSAENLCISYSEQYGLDTVIVRPCHTYGPNNTKNDNRANVQFVSSAIDGKDLVMKSKGLQLRSYAYIADVCSGLLTVLINGKRSEAYNLSNNNSIVTISGFASIVAEKSGVELRYELNDDQPSPFDKAVLDCTKLQGLGWKGKYDIEKGIEHTLEIVRWSKC